MNEESLNGTMLSTKTYLDNVQLVKKETLSTTNFTQNKVAIYPNPATDFITLSNLNKSQNYTVYNVLGKKVLSGTANKNQQINTQNLTNGLYFLQLEQGNTVKFIKE